VLSQIPPGTPGSIKKDRPGSAGNDVGLSEGEGSVSTEGIDPVGSNMGSGVKEDGISMPGCVAVGVDSIRSVTAAPLAQAIMTMRQAKLKRTAFLLGCTFPNPSIYFV